MVNFKDFGDFCGFYYFEYCFFKKKLKFKEKVWLEGICEEVLLLFERIFKGFECVVVVIVGKFFRFDGLVDLVK